MKQFMLRFVAPGLMSASCALLLGAMLVSSQAKAKVSPTPILRWGDVEQVGLSPGRLSPAPIRRWGKVESVGLSPAQVPNSVR